MWNERRHYEKKDDAKCYCWKDKLHRSETRGVADYQVRLFIALIIASPIIVSAGRATYSSFSHSDDAGTDVCKDESTNGLELCDEIVLNSYRSISKIRFEQLNCCQIPLWQK
ncbi:hypothetical protein Glove_232g119 [Diversispora epigaea]|uniref:Uncharacterized protein n=1 Tax=Diversispora epigaea TaxID=1348612 RepID=A0A397IHN5_9GLOM|nr:hypothetical protein Glove_232g119 [Diversispora epigaea]